MTQPADLSAAMWDLLFDAFTDRLMARLGPALEAVLEERQGMPDRLAYSVAEAAQALGLSDDTIRGEIASGRLEATRFGTAWRIPRTAIEARLLSDSGPRPVALPTRGRPRQAATRAAGRVGGGA